MQKAVDKKEENTKRDLDVGGMLIKRYIYLYLHVFEHGLISSTRLLRTGGLVNDNDNNK